jgi:hypothetical protein
MPKSPAWMQALNELIATPHRLEPALAAASVDRRGATSADPTARWALFAADNDPEKPTVRVTRRRQTTSDPNQRQTADASRRDTGSGQPGRSAGGSRGSSGGPPVGTLLPVILGLFSNRKTRPIGVLLAIGLVLWFLWSSIFGGGGGGDVLTNQQPSAPSVPSSSGGSLGDLASILAGAGILGQSVPEVMPTPAAPVINVRPTPSGAAVSGAGSAATAGGDTWTILIYADADDQVLEQDIFTDINEAERVGSSDNVKIVAQLDRFQGGYSGDGNVTGTRRYLITQDNDLNRIGSSVVQDVGEADMADPRTFVDFVKWGMQNYPADKYALILSDHGMGWPGGWSDPTSRTGPDRDFPLSRAMPHDMLWLQEVEAALATIRAETGLDKFELVGMDACLMSHLEVYTMLADHARYAVASQETEPALGWAYAAFLAPLVQNPSMTGADLGQLIVQTYIDGDQRILDDQARAEFTGGGRPGAGLFGGAPPAEAVARQLSQNITLTAADLSKIPALNAGLNNFLLALQQANPKAVAQARSYAQNYTSIFGSNVPPSYMDLGHFAVLTLQAANDPTLQEAAAPLINAINEVVVAEKNGPGKPGSTGISIYFPNSDLYRSDAAGPRSYNVAAGRFVDESLWDEFLTYFYTGNNFAGDTRGVSAPADGANVRSPGAGGTTLSPVTLSAESAAPGQPVLMSADVAGENIAFIKLFVGEVDPAAQSVRLIDSDYLQFGETRELNGVYYPDYGATDFTLEFEWEPYVTAVTDGSTNAVALFNPVSYGLDMATAQYGVDGVYTLAADGATLNARAIFRAGVLQQVFSYQAGNATGAPWEIVPVAGDTFTVNEQWLDMDAEGNVISTAYEAGATVTFGEGETLRWTELNAAPGQYVVGFVVEDLDGNEKATYAPVNVTAAQ